MTLEEIKKRLEKIEQIKHDAGVEHAMEDKLIFDFIEDLAQGKLGEISLKAKEILKVEDIDFARWYA